MVRASSMGMGVQTPENPSELGGPLVNAALEIKDRELLRLAIPGSSGLD